MTDPETQQDPEGKLLEESELRPLDTSDSHAPGKPWPGGADVNINFHIVADIEKQRLFINNATYVSPDVPVLLQMLSMSRSPHELMPAGSVYSLPRNKVVELSIPGGSLGGPVSSLPPFMSCSGSHPS